MTYAWLMAPDLNDRDEYTSLSQRDAEADLASGVVRTAGDSLACAHGAAPWCADCRAAIVAALQAAGWRTE